jgi:cyclase
MNRKFLILISTVSLIAPIISVSQDMNAISVRTRLLAGNVYMLDCVGDFGGGNVAASVGEDGILLVDAMYKVMNPKLTAALATLSSKPIRIVANSHFHGDHVEGSEIFSANAMVIGHENLAKRFAKATPPRNYPMVTFKDSLTIRFNGEVVRLIHVPNAHTDTDVIVYFEKSKLLHLGDIFFFGMFPAVYTEGGGNIRNMVASLDKILMSFPAETKVIPGHGEPASMEDLKKYVAMLKETISFVETGIKEKRSLTDLQSDPIMIKYKGLSDGGAQTTPQYVGMLYKLLK